LWKVPNAAPTAAWSPDGRSVLLGPTYLPAERADAEGLRGRAVAEVDVATGRFWQIPIPRQFALRGIGRLRWRSDGAIEVDNGEARLNFRKTDGRWQGVALTEEESAEPPAAPVRIELRQDLNTPPALYAVETASGRERMILDLNPRLRTGFTLGRVEHFTWQDEEGRTWSGLLYYPVHHAPSRRFPLVIQTHGHAPPTAFSLYGTGPGSLALGLGPSFSVFAAQPLANRDIAVLQVEDKNIEGVDGSPREPEMYMAAYQAAIERLIAKGLVAREKVGLVGYSRTGWHVEYALTHSPFPYAAAITTDNFDGSYLQALLHWTDEFAADNGAQPFGEGLKRWLERAPAFNADKLRAPLRLQLESGGLESVLAKWEMFARLRQLQKPVELFIIPDIEHGSHGLQNPAQCLAAQQGAVDWFDFWLNGREDPDLKKAEQYERWRKLRELHEANRRRDS
jgi:dienelactone hydrolase